MTVLFLVFIASLVCDGSVTVTLYNGYIQIRFVKIFILFLNSCTHVAPRKIYIVDTGGTHRFSLSAWHDISHVALFFPDPKLRTPWYTNTTPLAADAPELVLPCGLRGVLHQPRIEELNSVVLDRSSSVAHRGGCADGVQESHPSHRLAVDYRCAA